jgi:glycosyltransferase involved in cell wall biosynthesis
MRIVNVNANTSAKIAAWKQSAALNRIVGVIQLPERVYADAGMKAEVLYITYDGVLEPLGESQVVSYVERLARDASITLLSFEKDVDLNDRRRVTAMSRRLSEKNVGWVWLKYHKNPPVFATAFDVVLGLWQARRICRRRHVQILHARSYVPALVALGARSASHAAFLFDMRGFWVDEKVEAGHWKSGGLLYRVGKWWERRFYREADAVVSLTSAGARALPELGVMTRIGVPVEVIPTCADLDRFTPAPKEPELLRSLGLEGSIVIGCVGTMENWYMRHDMIGALACFARSMANVKILLVTRDDHRALRADLEAAGIPPERLVITRVMFAEMPRWIRLFDAGVFFIRPAFSKRASAATKLAEFLGCGIPVIINDGVGDSGPLVRDGGVGVVLDTLGDAAYEQALPKIREMLADHSIHDRCRGLATKVFDVRVGADRYNKLYQYLATGPGRPY